MLPTVLTWPYRSNGDYWQETGHPLRLGEDALSNYAWGGTWQPIGAHPRQVQRFSMVLPVVTLQSATNTSRYTLIPARPLWPRLSEEPRDWPLILTMTQETA